MVYLLLFWEFFKVGLFAVGGGLATIPFLYDIAAKYPDWFTSKMLADMIAVSESTPGPVGINMATYAGYHAGGVLGGLIATLALVLPSLVIIMIISGFLNRFRESQYVKKSFYCIRPAVTALIGVAWLELLKISVLTPEKFQLSAHIADFLDWKCALLFAGTLWAILKFDKHPILYIAIAGALGIVFKL